MGLRGREEAGTALEVHTCARGVAEGLPEGVKGGLF